MEKQNLEGIVANEEIPSIKRTIRNTAIYVITFAYLNLFSACGVIDDSKVGKFYRNEPKTVCVEKTTGSYCNVEQTYSDSSGREFKIIYDKNDPAAKSIIEKIEEQLKQMNSFQADLFMYRLNNVYTDIEVKSDNNINIQKWCYGSLSLTKEGTLVVSSVCGPLTNERLEQIFHSTPSVEIKNLTNYCSSTTQSK